MRQLPRRIRKETKAGLTETKTKKVALPETKTKPETEQAVVTEIAANTTREKSGIMDTETARRTGTATKAEKRQ